MISKVYLFTREHLVGTTLKRVPQLKLQPPVSILKGTCFKARFVSTTHTVFTDSATLRREHVKGGPTTNDSCSDLFPI